MHETLRGRHIVLAGGSGGLGRATAELLAGEGARLTVSFRANAERAKALGGIADLLQADLTKAEDRTRLLDAAPELYGLVVFAGDPSRVKDQAEMQTPNPSIRSAQSRWAIRDGSAEARGSGKEERGSPNADAFFSTEGVNGPVN